MSVISYYKITKWNLLLASKEVIFYLKILNFSNLELLA